jgi:hypothetical protein
MSLAALMLPVVLAVQQVLHSLSGLQVSQVAELAKTLLVLSAFLRAQHGSSVPEQAQMPQLVLVVRQAPQALPVMEVAPTLTVVSVFLRLLPLLPAEEEAQMPQLVSVSQQVQQALSGPQVLLVAELAQALQVALAFLWAPQIS